MMYRLLAICAALPLLAGCLGETAPPGDAVGMHASGLMSDSGRVIAEVTADEPIALGSNDLVIQTVPAEGESIDAVAVTSAVALMPAHGHDVRPGAIQAEGDAYRLHDLHFGMSGRWEITVDLDEDGEADTLRFAVEVP